MSKKEKDKTVDKEKGKETQTQNKNTKQAQPVQKIIQIVCDGEHFQTQSYNFSNDIGSVIEYSTILLDAFLLSMKELNMSKEKLLKLVESSYESLETDFKLKGKDKYKNKAKDTKRTDKNKTIKKPNMKLEK